MSISQIKLIKKFLRVIFIALNVIYIVPTYASNNLPLQNNQDESLTPNIHEQLAGDIQENGSPILNKIRSYHFDEIKNLQFFHKDLIYFYEIFNTVIVENIIIPELIDEEKEIIKYIYKITSGHSFSANSFPFYQDSNITNINHEELLKIKERSFIGVRPRVKNITGGSEHKKIFCLGGRRADKTRNPKEVLKKVNKDYPKIRAKILQGIQRQQLQNQKKALNLVENSTFHLVKNSIFFEARRLMTIEILYDKLSAYLKSTINNNDTYNIVMLSVNKLLEIPLCLAAQQGRVAIIEYLISKGVNPQCKRCTFITDDEEERQTAEASPYEYAMKTFNYMNDPKSEDKEIYIDINQVISLLDKHKVEFEVSKNTPKISEDKLNAIKNSPVKYPSGLSSEILHTVWNRSLTEEQIRILKSLDAKSREYAIRHTHL